MKYHNLPVFIEGEESLSIREVLKTYGVTQIYFYGDHDEATAYFKSEQLQKSDPLIVIKKRELINFDFQQLLLEENQTENFFLAQLKKSSTRPCYGIDLDLKPFLLETNQKLHPDAFDDIGVYFLANDSEFLNIVEGNSLELSEWRLRPSYTIAKNLFKCDLTPALFLDRDGVVNTDKEYLFQVNEFEVVPGVISLIKTANQFSLPVVIVTNQSGVGRGYYKEEDMLILHDYIQKEFEKEGAYISSWHYCFYHPQASREDLRGESFCRKPFPGMILEAAHRWQISLSNSLMVGDKCSDYIVGDLISQTFHLQGNYPLDKAQGKIVDSLSVVEEFIKSHY